MEGHCIGRSILSPFQVTSLQSCGLMAKALGTKDHQTGSRTPGLEAQASTAFL